ncbi:MAG: LuxR family transcriptional regulator [Hyphomicrobiales bacterium]|nr:MAG: LuxR family transcriptional regulator [Hyphomicrobiales bacterium]
MADISARSIRLAISVTDEALSDRLAEVLGRATGIILVPSEDEADVVLRPAGEKHPAEFLEPALTPREIEVLSLLAEGASNKAIAQRLGISAHTAKFHVGRVLEKLDATGRTDAVAHAVRIGVLNL